MGLTEKIQSLTTKANQKTGQQDSTLSEAVDTLIDGYDRIPEGYVKPTGTLDIGTDGEHNVKNYEKVNVLTNLQSVTVNPSEHWNVIIPEQSSNAIDGFSEIYVNPIPSEYVKPTGTLNIGAGGEYDVTNYKKAYVSTDLTPITVTAEPGPGPTFYGPGESDTTITGFSYVVVNPIPSQYIIPTGTEEITVTENGTVTADVTNKARVTVNVDVPILQPTGTKEISVTENGTVTEDVSDFASVEISVDVPTAPVEPDYDEVTLPSEYQRVEYIESSGTQYIDIPIGFEPTDEVHMVGGIPNQGADKFLVCTQRWNTSNNRYGICGSSGRNNAYAFGSASTSDTTTNQRADGSLHDHEYKDGFFKSESMKSALGTGGFNFGAKTANLRLFYGYNANTSGKLRYYVHKKADETGVALYACYRKADGVIGMYDIINDVFYTNSGTGTFTKSADI